MEDIDIRSWGSPDGRIISGKPQRPSHGVKLASIHSIRTLCADQTGRNVLDASFLLCGAHRYNTCRGSPGVLICPVAVVYIHSFCSGSRYNISRIAAKIDGIPQGCRYMAPQNLGIGQIRVLSRGINGILVPHDLDIRQIPVFLVFGLDGIFRTCNSNIRYAACIACCACIRIARNRILVTRYKNIFKIFRVGRIIGQGFHFQYVVIPYNAIAVPFHTVLISKNPRIWGTYISACSRCNRAVLAAQDIGICPSNPVLGANCPRRNTGCPCVCSYSQRVFCQCLSRISHSGSTFTVTFGITADGDGFVIRNTGRITNGNRFIYTDSTIFYRRRRKSPYSQWVISGCLSASPDCRVILITADG